MHLRQLRVLMLLGLFAVVLTWIVLLCLKWPFSMHMVVKALETETHRPVGIGAFHSTFLPPGYVAENVSFGKAVKTNGLAFAVRKMIVTATWFDLITLRKRIKLAEIEGLHMRIVSEKPSERNKRSEPPKETPPRFSAIGELRLEDAAFDFVSDEAETEPLTITLRSVSILRLSRRVSSPFQVRLSVNEPTATIRSKGILGPWDWSAPGKTTISGSFVIEQADLRPLGGVAGPFTGRGQFKGPLVQVICTGDLTAPNFQVRDYPRHAELSTNFRLTVNGLNGDTILNQVNSKLNNNTAIQTVGAIKEDQAKPGKRASLHFLVNGRSEDLLTLFSHSGQPSMTGALNLEADVELPPGAPGFLKKLAMTGDFSVHGGRFASAGAQDEVNHLGKSAEGLSKKEENENGQTISSDLKAHVEARNGIARLSAADWSEPGTDAKFAGTYNLLNTALDLHGRLRTTGKLSDTTSGLKALLVKVATPLWKKNSETVVPFTITGNARKPAFTLAMKKPSP